MHLISYVGYDSMGAYRPNEQEKKNLSRFLSDVFDKGDQSKWTFQSEKCAKQNDSHSCGKRF